MADNLNKTPTSANKRAKTPRTLRSTKKMIEENTNEEIQPHTPKSKRKTCVADPQTPQTMGSVNKETLRRSARKSVKPMLDYNEIVGITLQSAVKDNENLEVSQIHWNAVEVGRISSKRGRKKKTQKHIEQNEKREPENIIEEINLNNIDNSEEILKNENEIKTHKNEDNKNELLNVIEMQPENIELKKTENIENVQENIKELGDDIILDLESCKNISNEIIIDNKKTEKPKEDLNNDEDIILPHTKINAKDLDLEELGLKPLECDSSEENKSNEENLEYDAFELQISESEAVVTKNEEEAEPTKPALSEINKKEPLEFGESVFEPSAECESVEVKMNCSFTIEKNDEQLNIEDMDALILSDNDEDENKTTNNDTFNASDCIMISPNTTIEDSDIETINLLTIKKPNPKNYIETPKITITEAIIEINSPNVIGDTPNHQSSKLTRQPTPFKAKLIQNPEDEDDLNDQTIDSAEQIMLPVVNKEVNEIVLQSIVKKPLSMSINTEELSVKRFKMGNRVTFHSPANQTAVIEELDELIMNKMDQNKDKETDANFITERRKRSFSFDESLINKMKIQKTSNRTITKTNTPQKSHLVRTKLPNFAAIHQKQFEKMENLVEHVTRKAERARELSNSTGKIRSASKVLTPRNIEIKDKEKPKALRKIDLPEMQNVLKTMEENILPKKTIPIIRPPPPQAETKKSVIPIRKKDNKPKLNLTNKMKVNEEPQKLVNLKDSSKIFSQHKVNLSTPAKQFNSTKGKSGFAADNTESHNQIKLPVIAFNASKKFDDTNVKEIINSNKDKVNARRQRCMEMFKGRRGRGNGDTSETNVASKQQLIKGVRSNRRFELQMQHRRNLE